MYALALFLTRCRHLFLHGLLKLWFVLSFWLFFLLEYIFNNSQNAEDIRTFWCSLAPGAPMTLNLTKTSGFYSKSWPQGPKTQAKWPVSGNDFWGSLGASFGLPPGFLRSEGPRLRWTCVDFTGLESRCTLKYPRFASSFYNIMI